MLERRQRPVSDRCDQQLHPALTDHVAGRLRSLRDSGLDRLGLVVGGGDLGEAEVRASIELLARDVFPVLDAQSVGAEAVVPI